MTGIYTSITNDQEDLSYGGGIITKEQWLQMDSSGQEWIETGTTKGPINTSDHYISNWSGHSTANNRLTFTN